MLDLALFFSMVSLISVGGISSVLPEVQRYVVDVRGWMSADEFVQLFAIAQAAPGPNVLIVSLIGWKVFGLAGALVALAAMCGPAAALSWWVSGLWERFRDRHWRIASQKALGAIAIGFVLSSGYVLATPNGIDWRNATIAGSTALALTLTKWNPLWMLAAGGVAGAFLF